MAYLTGQTEQGNCRVIGVKNGIIECEPQLTEKVIREGNTNQWHLWHARIEGKKGEKVKILLHWPKFDPELVADEYKNAANYDINWKSFARPAQDAVFISTDRLIWTRIEDITLDDHDLYWEVELPADTCYFAVTLYYTPEMLKKLVKDLNGNPYVKQEIIGNDYLGDKINAFTVTDFSVPADKKTGVFFTAAQHCSEFNGCHLCDFAMRYLSSDDERAKELRQKYVYFFVPVASVSAWRQGLGVHPSGINPNRDWINLELPSTNAIHNWLTTLNPVPAILFDLHSGLANYGDWVNCQGIGVFPDLPEEKVNEQKRFIDLVFETCDFLPTCRYWDQFGANPHCFDGYGYNYGQVECFEISMYAMYDREAGHHFPIDQSRIKRFTYQLLNTIDAFFESKE